MSAAPKVSVVLSAEERKALIDKLRIEHVNLAFKNECMRDEGYLGEFYEMEKNAKIAHNEALIGGIIKRLQALGAW